jgi:predicted phosphoadenosine phosphosulfate sulfurtransferase
MSKGLKISINHKREIYLSSRNSKNPKLKEHYKSYCKLLLKVIKEAKILHYKKHILTSHNKTKTTWNIVKSKTG